MEDDRATFDLSKDFFDFLMENGEREGTENNTDEVKRTRIEQDGVSMNSPKGNVSDLAGFDRLDLPGLPINSDGRVYHTQQDVCIFPKDDFQQDDAQDDPNMNEFNDEFKENFNFINGSKSKSTTKKTRLDISRFQNFLTTKKSNVNFENDPPRVLDRKITTYIRDLKKIDGTDYEPSSINAILGSIDQHLRENSYPVSIMDSSDFKNTREMVAAKKKILKISGKGNRPQKAEALTDDEVNTLWDKGGFGFKDPDTLTAAVWWLVTTNFGWRASHEARQLEYQDIERKMENGWAYYIFHERQSKTRIGTTSDCRSFEPKAWANNTSRCPVMLLDEYNMRKPNYLKQVGQPFFSAINRKRKDDDPSWYRRGALGHNTLSAILPNACKRAGLQGRHTNHAARKTAITTLLHNGVAPSMIIQHSGHKSIDSLRHYATASKEQQQEMSLLLASRDIKADFYKELEEKRTGVMNPTRQLLHLRQSTPATNAMYMRKGIEPPRSTDELCRLPGLPALPQNDAPLTQNRVTSCVTRPRPSSLPFKTLAINSTEAEGVVLNNPMTVSDDISTQSYSLGRPNNKVPMQAYTRGHPATITRYQTMAEGVILNDPMTVSDDIATQSYSRGRPNYEDPTQAYTRGHPATITSSQTMAEGVILNYPMTASDDIATQSYSRGRPDYEVPTITSTQTMIQAVCRETRQCNPMMEMLLNRVASKEFNGHIHFHM